MFLSFLYTLYGEDSGNKSEVAMELSIFVSWLAKIWGLSKPRKAKNSSFSLHSLFRHFCPDSWHQMHMLYLTINTCMHQSTYMHASANTHACMHASINMHAYINQHACMHQTTYMHQSTCMHVSSNMHASINLHACINQHSCMCKSINQSINQSW